MAGAPVELELHRIRLAPVAKVTAFFAATTTALWVAAVTLLWMLASAFGATASIEQLVRDLGFEGFRIELGPVFLAVLLVGSVWIIALVATAFVFAASYNAFAAAFGGLQCSATARGIPQPDDDGNRRQAPIPSSNGHDVRH